MTIFGLIGKVILSIVKLPLVLVKGILGIFKKKKPKDDEEKEEEVEDKKRKVNIIFLLIPIVLVAILLVVVIRLIPTVIGGQGDPEEKTLKLPETYFSDSIKIKALYAGSGKDTEGSSAEEPEQPPEDLEFSIQEPPKEDKDSSDTETITATIYTYSGVPEPSSVIKTFVGNTIYEYGFSLIDEEFYLMDTPDYDRAEGIVRLGLEQDDTLLFLSAEWTEDSCIITTDSFAGAKISERESLSLDEAVNYLYSIPPSKLGIETDRPLQSYRIYAMDGIVMVNGYPCMRLNIYDAENPQNTNTITGQYFMTSDGKHIFHIDTEGNITEVNL